MRVYLKYIFLICFLFTNCFSQEQDSSLEDIILIVKGYSEHSYNNVMSYWRELYNVPTNSDKNILKIVVKSFDAVPNEENCKLLLSTLMNIFVAHFVEHVDERNCNEDYYIFLGNETLQEFAKCFELGNRSLKKQSENKKKYTLIGCAVFGVVIIGWLFVKAKGKWKKTILNMRRKK